MKLCHNGRSSGSQKVRMVLAEKNLPFESRIMDLQKGDQFDSAYVKLNPAALVPTLEDQGQDLYRIHLDHRVCRRCLS